MEYTEEMQCYLDLDWFVVDPFGKIAHFASSGGKLPSSVAKSEEDNTFVISFMRSLPDISDQIIINPNLEALKNFNSSEAKTNYLDDFLRMSKKGLYSFDKSVLNDFLDGIYHLVAKPITPLDIKNVPKDIAEIIMRTKISLDISNTDMINSNNIL